jgi:hypothetical protein
VAEVVSADDTETLPEPAEAEPSATSAPREEQPVTQRRLPQEPEGDHRPKFRFVYAALAAIAALAAVGLVFLLAEPGSDPAQAWSTWEPVSDEPLARAQEIANEVAAAYRLPSGEQLVYVQAEAPQVQDIPVAAVAIRSAPGGATFTGEGIPVFPADETVVYILCGLGRECSIEEGDPSEERLRLLRREALELALYTFQYVDGVNNVVAFLPPRAGYRPTYALFFQRPDLEALLDQPLRNTLPASSPPLPEEISPVEVNIIDGLTQPRFYAFAFQQLQDGQAVMVLEDPTRVPPPEPIEPAQTETTGETGSEPDTGSTSEADSTTGIG